MRPPTPAAVRFWSHVTPDGSCLLWTGYLCGGYGRFRQRPTGYVYAHRFLWSLLHGPIPAGMHLHRTCPCGRRRCLTGFTLTSNEQCHRFRPGWMPRSHADNPPAPQPRHQRRPFHRFPALTRLAR